MDINEILETIIRAGYSQVDIAKEIGVKQPTVSRYLAGDFKTMKHPVYLKTMLLYKKALKSIKKSHDKN